MQNNQQNSINPQAAPDTLVRLKEVQRQTGLSRALLYLRIQNGDFPRQVSLGNGRAVAWSQNQVSQWIAHQIETSRNKIK